MAHASLSEMEKKALNLIKKEPGILQSTLWRRLKLDSREGSRLVLRLVRKGLVRREQVSINGRRTYKLYPIEGRPSTQRLVVDIGIALGIPCTTCPHFKECGSHEFYDPTTCPILDGWLEYIIKRKRARLYPSQTQQ